MGKVIIYLSSQSSPLDVMAPINRCLTEERQAGLQSFAEEICKAPEGPAEDPLLWIGDPSTKKDAAAVLVISTQLVKNFTSTNMATLWRRIIRHPEIARGFFPFIRSGFETLCNQTQVEDK
jgi:hypothetical protein